MLNKFTANLSTNLKKIWQRPNIQAVIIITSFVFLSRIMGFFRQILVYKELYQDLGGLKADLLLSANKIPEFLSVFLLIGTLYSSVLPVATRLEKENPDKMYRYLNLIIITFTGGIGLLSLLLFVFTEPLLRAFGPEIWQAASSHNLTGEYILTSRILLLGPINFCLQSILSVFLGLRHRFALLSFAGIIANTASILGLYWSDGDFVKAAIGMIWGTTLSSLLYLWAVLRLNYSLEGFTLNYNKIKQNFSELYSELGQTWKVFLPRIFIIDAIFASQFLINPIAATGEIAGFDIAMSIQGAFFIIIGALSTVLFPDLAKTLHNKDLKPSAFWNKLEKYNRISLLLGIVVTLITIIGSPIIMQLFTLLGKGSNNAEYIVKIAQISSIGLIFRAVRETMSKYFFVKERVWQPTILSSFALGMQVLVVVILTKFQVNAGIAVALSLSVNNLVWVIVASRIMKIDKQKERTLEESENV